jgi:hypothetical protein
MGDLGYTEFSANLGTVTGDARPLQVNLTVVNGDESVRVVSTGESSSSERKRNGTERYVL